MVNFKFIKRKEVCAVINDLTVNKHSSVRIAASKIIRIDPFQLDDEPHDADIILITHQHPDHFSKEDIAKVEKADTVFVAPKSMEADLRAAGIPDTRRVLIEAGETVNVLGFDIEAVPAYNIGKPFHPKASGWVGYIVNVGGGRIYVCGDTDDIPEGRAVSCDIVCVPVGGKFTMDAREAAVFVKAMSPKIAVPIHFGDAAGFPSAADEFEKALGGAVKVVRKI